MINDPDNYERCSVAYATADEAKAALDRLGEIVNAAREELPIAELALVAQVYAGDEKKPHAIRMMAGDGRVVAGMVAAWCGQLWRDVVSAKSLMERALGKRRVASRRRASIKKMRRAFPDQRIYRDEDGRARFRKNAIVRYLLDAGGIDLNALAEIDFKQRDWDQFYQLIGYDLVGYVELSCISDEAKRRAERAMERAGL